MKPIFMLKDHPTIKNKQLESHEQVLFIIKQMKDLESKVNILAEAFWADVRTYIRENKLADIKDNSSMSFKDGVLFLHDGNEKSNSVLDALKNIFK